MITARTRTIVIAVLVIGGAFMVGRVWRDRRGAAGSASTSRGTLPTGRVVWQNVADAPRLASAANKPILYDFNAEWCGPCHQLDRTVFSDEEAAAFINEHFVPVSVVDRQEEDGHNPPDISALQRRYEIDGFPTLVIADAGGSPKGKIIGYAGKGRTIEFLKQTR